MIRAPNALAMPNVPQAQSVYYDANGVWQWDPYAVGGATRPDSFTDMNPEFRASLERMFADAPAEIRDSLRVSSGYRSPERQAQLWEDALQRYGSPEAARQWVAPPGNSQHNHGNAADLRYLDPAAREWAHQNAANYGLSFPLGNEDWHIELATARGGHAPAPDAPRGQPILPPQNAPQTPPNALSAPSEAQLAAMAHARRQQAYNALSEALRRPIYDNVMQGSPR